MTASIDTWCGGCCCLTACVALRMQAKDAVMKVIAIVIDGFLRLKISSMWNPSTRNCNWFPPFFIQSQDKLELPEPIEPPLCCYIIQAVLSYDMDALLKSTLASRERERE
jgi:hypothetical protein